MKGNLKVMAFLSFPKCSKFKANLCLIYSKAYIIVDDISASEDILGEIILYKPLRENIFVYFIISALYI